MLGFVFRKVIGHGWLVIALLSSAACGGGGGSSVISESSSAESSVGGAIPLSTSSSSSSAGSAAAVALQPAPTSIQASAYVFSNTAVSRSISLAMLNLPASTIYLSGRYSTKGIKSISVGWDAPNHATFTVDFKIPSGLAPGTYSDSILIRLCADSACSEVIPNSIVTVPVSYTVIPTSGAGAPAATLQQRSINVGIQAGLSSGPVGLGLSLSNFLAPPYILATMEGDAISSISATASTTSAQLTINLPASQGMGYGSYASVVTLKVCLDGPSCVYQAMGSPFQIPVSYVVYGLVAIAVSDIAWDAVSQRIYATEAGLSVGTGYLTRVNPVTRAIDWRLSIAAAPLRLAVSPDGLYAYVWTLAIDNGLNQSDPEIRKYRLSDQTQVYAIPLASNATDFKVSPGAGAYLVVSNSTDGLSLYNANNGALIDRFPSSSGTPEAIVWGDSASVLYSYDWINDVLREFAPTSSSFGLVRNKNVDLNANQSAWSGLHYDKGILMENHGAIYDVATATMASRLDLRTEFSDPNFLPYSVAAELDMAVGRSYFWYLNGSSVILQVYDMSTHTALAYLPTSSRSTFRLIRWGADGLAYLYSGNSATDSGIALVQGKFVAP